MLTGPVNRVDPREISRSNQFSSADLKNKKALQLVVTPFHHYFLPVSFHHLLMLPIIFTRLIKE